MDIFLTFQDTATKPQIELHSLFLMKIFRITHQFIWNTLDLCCFENFRNHFSEQKFPIKDENIHPKNQKE